MAASLEGSLHLVVGHGISTARPLGAKEHGLPQPCPSRQEGGSILQEWIATSCTSTIGPRLREHRPLKFFQGGTWTAPTWEFLEREESTRERSAHVGGVRRARPRRLRHPSADPWYWWSVRSSARASDRKRVRRGACRSTEEVVMDASRGARSREHGIRRGGRNVSGTTDNQQARTWTYGYLAGADCVSRRRAA